MASSSRSFIYRLTPFFAARIRQNQRLLSSSSSALPESQSSSPSPSPSPSIGAVHMTDNCVQKMKELQANEASGRDKLLRLSIEAGGCSGFQYNFCLEDKTNADDRIFERNGVKLVVDKISLDFVKGATVDYVEELIRSAFQLLSLILRPSRKVEVLRGTHYLEYPPKRKKMWLSGSVLLSWVGRFDRKCSILSQSNITSDSKSDNPYLDEYSL